MNPAYVYRARAKRVIDGDTLVCDVDLGFQASIEIKVRLHGVNTPEKGKPGAAEAAAFLSGLVGIRSVQIDEPRALILQSYKDARSFERWVCDVYLVGDDVPFSEHIIKGGFGKPFDPKVDHWSRDGQ
jgi:micrococcal nuclease